MDIQEGYPRITIETKEFRDKSVREERILTLVCSLAKHKSHASTAS